MNRPRKSSTSTASSGFTLLCLLLCASTLLGCTSLTTGMPLPAQPASLLQPCPPPADNLPPKPNTNDVQAAHAADVNAWAICNSRHDSLRQWITNLYKSNTGK